MLADDHRKGRVATCEDWDDRAGTTLPDTQKSANVAAKVKRSRPELVPGPELMPGEHAELSRTSTSTPNISHRMDGEERFGRESRPYSSGPPQHRRNSSRRNSSRQDSRPDVKRIMSEAQKPELSVRHHSGQCWICDCYGYHMAVPLDSKENCIPKSLSTASQPSQQQASSRREPSRPQPSAVQPRSNRSHSSRDRPMSFHGGMTSGEMHHPLTLQPFPGWSLPPTPVSPYPHTPSWPPFPGPDGGLPSTPVSPYPSNHNLYQDYPPSEYHPQPYNEQGLPPPRPRQTEPYREARGEPTIQQSSASWDQPALTRTTSQHQHRSRNHSLSREDDMKNDMKKMPPPPKPRRPSMVRERTSNTSISNQRSSYDPPAPPSSYREPPHSGHQDRPVPGKSSSYQDVKKTDNFAPVVNRRDSPPSTERTLPECHEIEAEAYQRSRQKIKPHPLTLDALSKIPPQPNSNTSSRGSSGGKTRTTAASTDITMMFSGVTLGISGDSADNHNINIQTKRNGGVNITVHDKTSLHDRSGSSDSSNRQRRRSVKQLTESGKRVQSLGPKPQKAIQASNRSGEALYDDSHGAWS